VKSERLQAGWISEEANAAAEIKKVKEIMVVLGNPPYSGISANRGKWIAGLVEDYRQVDGGPLAEKKVWLADDYVKFLRFAQWRIAKTGQGIAAMITNHGFLDNPTFRGMRQSLLWDFDEIYVLDLHGSTKKRQRPPGGGIDQNVFDIQQGVAISIFVRRPEHHGSATIYHADLWGTRPEKYECLAECDVAGTSWKKLSPSTPYYFFVPRSEKHRREYERFWKVKDVFPISTSGIVTARDHFVVDLDRADLKRRIETFCDAEESDDSIARRLGLSENYAWRVGQARRDLIAERHRDRRFARVLYRPFDVRHIYYHPAVVWRPREVVMGHMRADNLALATTRSVETGHFEHVLCTREMLDHHAVSLKEVNYLFPLYLRPNGDLPPDLFAHENGRLPNLSSAFVKALTTRLGVEFLAEGRGNLRKTVGPEDVFHYAYAVFHSPTYRERYAEFLRIDFPRLPLTSNAGLFRALAAKGADLVAFHLLESPGLDEFVTDWPVKGDNLVDKVQYAETGGRVWINKTQYFAGVPKAVWEFHIGGYQVCHKWLKDRKGRKLTYEDTQHYQKVVVALNETIRLMAEIDEVTCQHGDWPIQ
jgi:predicted helicase